MPANIALYVIIYFIFFDVNLVTDRLLAAGRSRGQLLPDLDLGRFDQ